MPCGSEQGHGMAPLRRRPTRRIPATRDMKKNLDLSQVRSSWATLMAGRLTLWGDLGLAEGK